MAAKRPKNLSIHPGLRTIAEAYCKANGRSFTEYVSGLLRDDLRKLGLPVDASIDDIMRFMRTENGSEKKPKRQKPRDVAALKVAK